MKKDEIVVLYNPIEDGVIKNIDIIRNLIDEQYLDRWLNRQEQYGLWLKMNRVIGTIYENGEKVTSLTKYLKTYLHYFTIYGEKVEGWSPLMIKKKSEEVFSYEIENDIARLSKYKELLEREISIKKHLLINTKGERLCTLME